MWESQSSKKNYKQLEIINQKDIFINRSYLKDAKYLILNGNITEAIINLNKVSKNPQTIEEKKFLQLLISTILNTDDKRNVFFTNIKKNPKLCSLMLVKSFLNNQFGQYNKTLKNCFNDVIKTERPYWPFAISEIVNSKDISIDTIDLNNLSAYKDSESNIIIWMKLNLISSNEKNIIDNLSLLDQESYQSEEIRELIGLAYYRIGNFEKALSFIDDLKSSNSLNIKGNLSLLKKQNEIAYGRFLLSLNKKNNSLSSLSRLLPLSWKVEKYNDGLNYAIRLINSTKEENTYKLEQLYLLQALFLTKLNKHILAKKTLDTISQKFGETILKENYVVNISNSFYNNQFNEFQNQTYELCLSYNSINCFFYLKTVSSEFHIFDKEISLYKKSDYEKLISQDNNQFQDDVFIDQRQIEELDSNL